jgi:hypothetical protein
MPTYIERKTIIRQTLLDLLPLLTWFFVFVCCEFVKILKRRYFAVFAGLRGFLFWKGICRYSHMLPLFKG